MALTHSQFDNPAEAEACSRRGLERNPDAAGLLWFFGLFLNREGRHEEALSFLTRYLELDPASSKAPHRIANLLLSMRRLPEAIPMFREPLEEQPDDPEISFEFANCLLLKGAYAEGWEHYQHRVRLHEIANKFFTSPKSFWQGEPLETGPLLVSAEHGFGDVIQFCRFLLDLPDESTIRVQRELVSLLSRSFPRHRVIGLHDDPGTFAKEIPLLDLPRVLHRELSGISSSIPYLVPDPDRSAYWSERLQRISGRKVGNTWSSNQAHRLNHWRRIPLSRWSLL